MLKVEKIDYKNTINTKELTRNSKHNTKLMNSREKGLIWRGATKFGEAKGGHIQVTVNIPYVDYIMNRVF